MVTQSYHTLVIRAPLYPHACIYIRSMVKEGWDKRISNSRNYVRNATRC